MVLSASKRKKRGGAKVAKGRQPLRAKPVKQSKAGRKVTKRRHPFKKAKPTRQSKAEKISDEDFVRETLLAETGSHFEVIAPHPAFPLAVEKLEWFMRCRNREEIERAPYVNAVWKEKGDRFWFESLAVGDTVEWIELAYGEERATQSLDLDYSPFDEPSFQADFGRKFPIVFDRIREYEGVAARVSKSRDVRMELRRVGSRGMLVFTFAVRLDMPKRETLNPLGSAVKKSVSALKEAYEEITKL